MTIAFEVKGSIGGVAAIARPDGPELHVPIFHLPLGFEAEADVQLDRDQRLRGARRRPVRAGWALKRDKNHEAEETGARETEQGEPADAAVIRADLSQAVAATKKSRELTAILREAARRLQAEVWDQP
jgi:hypothetical protein